MLNATSARAEDQGLVLIGVTNEPLDVVTEWVRLRKPTFPIAVVTGTKFDVALGVKAFPSGAVIDPTGKIAYTGFEPASAAAKAQSQAVKGSIWPPVFAKAIERLRARDLGSSFSELARLGASDLSPREASARERLSQYVQSEASDALSRARESAARGEIRAAVRAIESIASADPPLSATAAAAAFSKELRAMPNFDAEMEGGALYASAVAAAEAKLFLDAVNAFRAIVQKFPGSKIAELAARSGRAIVEKGLPGSDTECLRCKASRRACKQHVVQVEW